MKRLLIATAAAATLAASFGGAASAQSYGYPQHGGYGQPQYGYNPSYGYGQGAYIPVSQRLDRIDDRIDRGVRRGDLTRREADLLRRDFRNLVQLEARYRYDGFNRWEREDLGRRTDQLAQRIRYERRDPEQRYDRDDRYDDDRYGRYDDRRDDYRRY